MVARVSPGMIRDTRPALERSRPMRLMPVSLAVLLTACGPSTEIVNSWRDPSAAGGIKFQKVITICICKETTNRRSVEDQLAKRIGRKATPSYTLISDQELRDPRRQGQGQGGRVRRRGRHATGERGPQTHLRAGTVLRGRYAVHLDVGRMGLRLEHGLRSRLRTSRTSIVDFNTYVYSVAGREAAVGQPEPDRQPFVGARAWWTRSSLRQRRR